AFAIINRTLPTMEVRMSHLNGTLPRFFLAGAVSLACFWMPEVSHAPLPAAAAYASSSQATAQELPRSSPESQGIASADIRAFVEAGDQQIDTMNSFMLVRHGRVVAEAWWSPYDAETPHILYSLSKSFTSTAVGLAIADGKLSLDDQVLKFF